MLAVREALDPAARKAFAAHITSRLLTLPSYRDARCVMAYMGFGTELDTTEFVQDVLARGKSLVLPRVERAASALRLHAVRDPAAELAAGIWGIREPRADLCAEVLPATVDFVLVPGVAFTARCERLGYGGGYYDRLLPTFAGRAFLAAAVYSAQIVPALPVTPFDHRVHLVVTEDGEYSGAPD